MITEVIFVKDPKPSSSELLFESVITLSHSGKLHNYLFLYEYVCKLTNTPPEYFF